MGAPLVPDVTLADLLALDDRLGVGTSASGGASLAWDFEAIPVSWAVSARTIGPHLPQLRGAELVLVPVRVSSILGPQLDALLREGQFHGVTAFLFEQGDPFLAALAAVDSVPLLVWSGALTPEVEATFNRRITEQRGELFRVGSALERALTDLMVNRGGIGAIVRVTAEIAGLPLSIQDGSGHVIASAGSPITAEEVLTPEVCSSLEAPLALGGRLMVGPLRPQQRLAARFLLLRIARGASAAFQHEHEARPRGAQRADAVAALLAPSGGDIRECRAAALALSLDPDGRYLVAISSADSDRPLERVLTALGAVHPASEAGLRVALIAISDQSVGSSLERRIAEVKRRWEADQTQHGTTLALSAPALGVERLADAADEARFVAMLQQRGAVSGRAASFAAIEDLGALRLLYLVREAPELRSFATQALGQLPGHDRRGTLRATLRAFLATGGSHADASHQLGIHRNTLAYRLRRLSELVGRDVADPASWLTLQLALHAADLLDPGVEDV
jgi:purine catabolism regulator